ncbi:hypothetical protein QR680_001322 [Steinernema hermaphroditum]|uniref:Uncharacterized protein n=1 Tax=Steinernema hermaphroditum TaxID=289476 RepID=A0AA39GYI7_9BILA|nr:hypothetical protein QR680_001322 [Steinernema hermaphroditum]
MSACSTCQHLQEVLQSKDEEIQKLQTLLSAAPSVSHLQAERESLLNKVRDYSLEIEKLNAVIDADKSNATQKENELSTKIKELEKQLAQHSGKSSGDLDRVLSQIVYKDNRILELNNTILDKERQILDLQEMCHEQGQVAQAKSQAMQIVQQKIIAFESRKMCDAATETDTSLLPRAQKPTRATSPGRAVAQIKFGVRTSPPPLDPSEDLSSFTTEQNGVEETEEEPGTSKSYRSKKSRKKVTFDLPPSAASSTFNLHSDNTPNAMQIVADLTAENDQLRRVISDMENIEFEKYKTQISKLESDIHSAKHEGRNQVLKARAAAQGRIKDLEERIATMQQEHVDESERLQVRIEQLTDDREWALLEKARLQDEVDTCKMRLHDLHEKCRDNEEIVFELNHRLAQEAQFSERLADDVQEAQFTANQLLEQKQMILDDVERLKEALFAQDELIGVLESDITIYEEHIGILRESLGASKKENYQIIKSKAFETKLRALEKEKDQMDKRNNDERLRTKALNKKVKTLQTENDMLREKLREAEFVVRPELNQPLQSEERAGLESADEAPRITAEEVESIRKQLQETSEQLHFVRCDNFDLQSELSRVKEENASLSTKLNELRNAVSVEEPVEVQNIELQTEKPTTDCTHQSIPMLEKLHALVSSFGEQHLSVDSVVERVEALEQKLADSSQNIGKLKSRILFVLNENAVLKEQNLQSQSEELRGILSEKDQQIQQLQDTLSSLTEDNRSLKDALDRLQSLADREHSAFLTQSAKIKELETNVEELQEQNVELRTARTEENVVVEGLQNHADDQNVEQLSGLHDNLALLKDEVAELKAERSAYEKTVTEQIETMERKLVENAQYITILKDDVVNLEQENEDLKEEKRSDEEALENLRRELADSQSAESAQNVTYLQNHLEALLKENASLLEERTMDEETLEALRKELVAVNNEVEKQRMLNGMLRTGKSEVENELNVARSEYAALEDEHKSDSARISSLQNYIAELNLKLSEADAAKAHVEELQSDIQTLMTEVVRLREENEEILTRPTQAVRASSSEESEEKKVDTTELFQGKNGELTKTPSGCLLLENQLLRDCVSETNRMHEDLTSDVNQMMFLNQELENAVDALKGEIWALNNKLKACFAEREELLAKVDGALETEKALHDLQEAYNSIVSKKSREQGTDPMESTTTGDDKKPYKDLLVAVGEELAKVRGSDLHAVREELGQLMTVFEQMHSSARLLLQRALDESAAKLTTKQADNDALFRANSELAHANVGLQNKVEQLQEKLDEALEANDRFMIDGQQLAEEKIVLLKNTIRSLEDRLELTEHLNKELEDKCYEAENREQIAELEIRSLKDQIDELTQSKQETVNGGGWDDWNSEQSDVEESKNRIEASPAAATAGKCHFCPGRDEEIGNLKGIVQEKDQEISFLKDRKCPHCIEKEDELNEMSLAMTEKDEEMAELKEDWAKRLESQQLDYEKQLAERSAEQSVVQNGWDDWAECQKCAEKDASLKQMAEALEQKERQIAVDDKPCENCVEKEESVNELTLILTQQSEEIADLSKRCEEYRVKCDQMEQERETSNTGSQEGWDDWSEECHKCTEKDHALKEVEEKLGERKKEIEEFRREIAVKDLKLQEACLMCVENEEQIGSLTRQISQKNEELKAMKECFEQKRVSEEQHSEESANNSCPSQEGWGEWSECTTCAEKDLSIQRLTDTLKDKQDAIEFLDHEVTRLRQLCNEPCTQCARKDKNIADITSKLKAANESINLLKNGHSNPDEESGGWNDWGDINANGASDFKLKDAHAELRSVQKQIETLRKIAASEVTSMALHFQNSLNTLSGMYSTKEKNTKQTLLTCKKKIAMLKKQNELLKDSECRLTDSTDIYARELEDLQKTHEGLKKIFQEKDSQLETEKSEKQRLDEIVHSLRCDLQKREKVIQQLKELISQKDLAIEELKQAATSATSSAVAKVTEEKLSEMQLQRDEANRKVGELQKRLRSIQQKRRLSTSSKASNSTSSQFGLNEMNEPVMSLCQSTIVPKPVVTNTIVATVPMPVQNYSEVSVSDDPIRRRAKK